MIVIQLLSNFVCDAVNTRKQRKSAESKIEQFVFTDMEHVLHCEQTRGRFLWFKLDCYFELRFSEVQNIPTKPASDAVCQVSVGWLFRGKCFRH